MARVIKKLSLHIESFDVRSRMTAILLLLLDIFSDEIDSLIIIELKVTTHA